MSKQPPSDSFLPSGAMESPQREYGPSRTSANIPRSMPISDYIPSPPHTENPKPYSPIQRGTNGSPLSPPKTRSGSAESSSATLIENWRAYTEKLTVQFKGERAHILADRERREEVMEEERSLWEEERQLLKDDNQRLEAENLQLQAELRRLKTELEIFRSHAASQVSTGSNSRVLSRNTSQRRVPTMSTMSAATASPGSIDGTPERAVPQETGRNADGTVFYAPAPVNPSRTFTASEDGLPGDNLRIDAIVAPREDPIRVTSRELTSSDFGVHKSPPHELATVSEGPVESIDISLIQPELEGVPIKATAVEPTFAAKVLSPNSSLSPARLSPNIHPPAQLQDATNLSRGDSQTKKPSSLEVMETPENVRLTLHAGHTPNHSVTNFSTLLVESGNATPRQTHHPHTEPIAVDGPADDASVFAEEAELDEDPALAGKLSLNTERSLADDAFLAELTERLEEAKKSEGVSPSSESTSSVQETRVINRDSMGLQLSSMLDGVQASELDQSHRRSVDKTRDGDDGETDDGPVLKLKNSSNFGKPMGTL
ncbi:hypothetical protein BP6252_11602 [Coleophoma cylindrospora]|uniref:Uncharacterized protein n=1 Tax=Coleophoma cylindrospora TaxID=1849047 RepID=A0A3D8QK61_9HELO|nr:hypothetical protein BP6252_11602 [Coleophoma cylindrospora]